MRFACTLAAIAVLSFATLTEASNKKPPPKPKAGVFDYYVLSLSWAPEYCKSHPTDKSECVGHQFGFVLHGLWPQYSKGSYPASCASSQKLDAEALALGKTVFPSETLVTHEWQKHGTCSGLTAKDYIQAADTAHKSVTAPALLQPGKNTRSVTLANVTQALLDANPALNRQSLAIACTGGELTEVRVCLSKELKPMDCGSDVKTQCSATVKLLGVQ